MAVDVTKYGWRVVMGAFGAGLLSAAIATSPVRAAEQLSIRGFGGQRSIAVSDLEIFATTGEITRGLDWYARRMTEEQLSGLREILTKPLEVEPRVVTTFVNDTIGETLLRRLSGIFWGGTEESNFKALRSSLVLSVYDEEGLTLLNAIRKYPLRDLRLNLDPVLQAAEDLQDILIDSRRIFAHIQEEAAEGVTSEAAFLATLPDPRLPGAFDWSTETIAIENPERDASQEVLADVYLPEGLDGPAPTIVISHGMASSRSTFVYVAEHLASQGFAVALLEHPSSDATRYQQYIAGFAEAPEPRLAVLRPLDITALLDTLEELAATDPAWEGRVRTDRVGVLGQSLGGYTALAAGGAQFDIDYLEDACEDSAQTLLPFNLSLLLQCRVLQLTEVELQPVSDSRVAAVLAVNPVSSSVFGPEGLGQIEVPVMVVAGTNDFFAPAVAEQIEPFTWLETEERYLVLVENGTHFTFLPGGSRQDDVFQLPQVLIGPDPELGHPGLRAMATVFFNTHVVESSEYEPYLTEFLLPSPGGGEFNFALTRGLTAAEVEEAVRAED